MKTKIRIIAIVVLVAILAATVGIIVACQREPEPEQGLEMGMQLGSSPLDTFMGLLEKGVSAGVSAGASEALKPLVSMIGTELLGLPATTSLQDIKAQLDEIEGKLDDIRKEVAEGIEKVLSEMDKNNKMRNAIDALARAEYLADLVLGSDLADVENAEELSGAEQQRLVEINANAISKERVDELIDVLGVAGEYLSTGYIDTNYENAFKIYYDYMKRQSMFCGEAAARAEAYWQVMIESYAKSSIALLCALEQQLSMHDLSKETAGEQLKQEAIDAALAAVSHFDTYNVIENHTMVLRQNARTVLVGYKTFLAGVREEATVFINKKTCYIRLKPDLGIVNLGNLDSYDAYAAGAGFAAEGVTEDLYRRGLKSYSRYFYANSYHYIDMETVTYNEFTTNQGKCDRYDTYSDMYGSYDVRNEVDWATHSGRVFTNVMLNLKAIQYNSASKLAHDSVQTILDHVSGNYSSKTVADYLTMVGFRFGENDITAAQSLYLLTADLNQGNRLDRVGSDGRMYDLADLSKKYASFENTVNTEHPAGKLVYFENADESIRVTIESDGMDNRIYKGVYTLTAKEVVDYKADGTPVYTYYEKVYEVEGTKNVYIDLPTNIDFSTIEVTLGYEGLAASDNHAALCSYNFANYVGAGKEITLRMEGYTKWWGGYGVDAEILCDGNSLTKGEG